MTRRLASLVVAAGLLVASGFAQQGAVPHRRAGEQPLEFRGPGREEPAPDVEEVVLGWFGPDDPDHPDFGELWRGAVLALDAENAAGGYRGAPFRLVSAWSESPWHAAAARLTRLVYDRGAWAVIGGVDGATTHLAEQVALKARFPLLSPGSTDATANCGHVPWLFTALPPDDRQAGVLVARLREVAGGALAVAAAVDHDSHATLRALRREMATLEVVPRTLVEFDPAEPDPGPLAARLVGARPAAVLVIAPARPAAALVGELRRRGFAGEVVGGATLARNVFVRAAGPAAEGVLAPLLHEASPAWDAFGRDYEARWHGAPDGVAAQAYDAVRFLASAVRASGLNRARIADALRSLAPWRGAAGVISWDALGRNQRAVGLAAWRGGRQLAVGDAGASDGSRQKASSRPD